MTDAHSVFAGGVLAVTGGGSGVGEGLARYGASLGMKVAIADIDIEAARAVADDLVVSGTEAIAVHTDVRDAGSVDAFFATVYDTLGPVTLAINNAGVEQFGYLWEVSAEEWQRVLDINVTGVFNGVRSVVPRMAEAGVPAHIWNLSSIGGIGAAPRQAPYIVSKHSTLALTECLKLEVEAAGYDITVAAVLPGPVVSRIFERAGGDSEAGALEREAMFKVGESAMPALEAAERIFAQAADGAFYLSTHPEMTGYLMNGRAEQLRARSAPQLPVEA
ncbi:SDR family NAD(P)-dependent oxidoreductase [Rhodococcus sp. C26F]